MSEELNRHCFILYITITLWVTWCTIIILGYLFHCKEQILYELQKTKSNEPKS